MSSGPSWLDLAEAWLDPTKAVIPLEAVFPQGVTQKQADQESTDEMTSSQQSAISAALTNLGYDVKGNVTGDQVHDISKMILKAPLDGMIVERDVVAGNFYDDMAVLMVISPMDKLWVWGNVFEKDQAQVHLG